MSLLLYFHPLASFCHKVLLALYENGTPFEGHVVDLADPEQSSQLLALWPVGKIPVLRDEAQRRTVAETSIIIEYLDRYYPGAAPLVPGEFEGALEVRLWDRFFDLYVAAPMQKIVADRLRRDGEHDPAGVADAMATLKTAYDMIERQVADKPWATGAAFTMADCAAAPALFYADMVCSYAPGHPAVAAYVQRLEARPSFQRTITEARPYLHLFPFRERIPARFLSGE